MFDFGGICMIGLQGMGRYHNDPRVASAVAEVLASWR